MSCLLLYHIIKLNQDKNRKEADNVLNDYNYEEAIYDDIISLIDNHFHVIESCYYSDSQELDRNDLYDLLYDDMWIIDDVTGNASGSYTFNAYKAEEYLCHNWQLLEKALITFGYDCSINILEKGAEWCDVIIRCYLLSDVLQNVIDEHADEWEKQITASLSNDVDE